MINYKINIVQEICSLTADFLVNYSLATPQISQLVRIKRKIDRSLTKSIQDLRLRPRPRQVRSRFSTLMNVHSSDVIQNVNLF